MDVIQFTRTGTADIAIVIKHVGTAIQADVTGLGFKIKRTVDINIPFVKSGHACFIGGSSINGIRNTNSNDTECS